MKRNADFRLKHPIPSLEDPVYGIKKRHQHRRLKLKLLELAIKRVKSREQIIRAIIRNLAEYEAREEIPTK